MEFYAAERKKELLPCDSMDGTGEHYAKRSKPGGERQIPCDLTYKWNLINEINKLTKQNRLHGNKEGTPTLCDSMDGAGEYYAK